MAVYRTQDRIWDRPAGSKPARDRKRGAGLNQPALPQVMTNPAFGGSRGAPSWANLLPGGTGGRKSAPQSNPMMLAGNAGPAFTPPRGGPTGGGDAPGRTATTPQGAMYGAIGRDSTIDTSDRAAVAARLAEIRENRRLDADSASDQVWVDRIASGAADFGSARQALDRKSGEFGQTFQSASLGNPYPSKLPGLSAEDFADLAARRRSADSSLEQALASHGRLRGQAEAGTAAQRELLRQRFAGAQDNAMRAFGDFGAARQPRQAGRAARDLRNEHANERGALEVDHASRLRQLQEMVEAARAARTSTLGEIDAESTRRRSDLSQMIQALGVR